MVRLGAKLPKDGFKMVQHSAKGCQELPRYFQMRAARSVVATSFLLFFRFGRLLAPRWLRLAHLGAKRIALVRLSASFGASAPQDGAL